MKTAKAPRMHYEGRDARFYEVDGELYPSVTTILKAIDKPALVWWAANRERDLVTQAAADLYAELQAAVVPASMPRAWYLTALLAKLGPAKAHQKLKDEAANIGSETHKLIEYTMRRAIGADAGAEPLVSKPALVAFQAWQQWAASVSLKPILIERVVVSTQYQFAGTLDLLARVNGVPTAIDFKTGKGVYQEAHLQNAAYRSALIEMGYLPPAGGGLIVRLPKTAEDPAMEVVPVDPVDALLPVFLSVQDLWQWSYPQDVKRLADWKAKRQQVA